MNSSFPASLLNRGAGLVVPPKLVRISPSSCQLVQCASLWKFSSILHSLFFRALAFPCLLSGPVSPPAGGQLQPAGGDPLQVQHRAWEAAGHPMEEGRTSLGPAFPWSAASQQRLPGRRRRRGRELPMRCQPAWRRHNPLHCHTSRACR